MEKEYAVLWEDNITIDSDSELIDEQKFVGKRKYLDQLIYQINHSYANNCYDAVAVLMREDCLRFYLSCHIKIME